VDIDLFIEDFKDNINEMLDYVIASYADVIENRLSSIPHLSKEMQAEVVSVMHDERDKDCEGHRRYLNKCTCWACGQAQST